MAIIVLLYLGLLDHATILFFRAKVRATTLQKKTTIMENCLLEVFFR